MAKALPSLARIREAVGAAVEATSTLFLGFGGFDLDPPAIFLALHCNWTYTAKIMKDGFCFWEEAESKILGGDCFEGVFGERERINRRKDEEGNENGNSVLHVLAPF